MITTVLSRKIGEKVYVVGLEKDDIDAILQDAVLTFEIRGSKVALHIVKSSKSDYIESIKKLFKSKEVS